MIQNLKDKIKENMTPKQQKLIETYIRSKVKRMLKEDNSNTEVIDRSIKTIDRISDMLRGLQRDLFMYTKNPDYKVAAEKITEIIKPLGKMTDQVLFKIEDLDEDPPFKSMT